MNAAYAMKENFYVNAVVVIKIVYVVNIAIVIYVRNHALIVNSLKFVINVFVKQL